MGRRSNPRLWLLLLRTGQNRNLRRRGFSLAVALIVLMVAMVSAGTLALRSASSHSVGGGTALPAGRSSSDQALGAPSAGRSTVSRGSRRSRATTCCLGTTAASAGPLSSS